MALAHARRLALPLLLGVSLLAPAGAEDRPTLDLSRARVLASPGWPAALEGFLPPGRPVERLTYPLPSGGEPLLVLGLWDSDPVARALMEDAFGVDPLHGLRGGYVAMAGDVKGRIAVIFAHDAAALAAARFELETFMPNEVAMTERRVEVTQPDEQAGVRMALARRDVVPAFRVRALGGLGPGEGPLDVAAAHGNRLWLEADEPHVQGSSRSLSLLREHGVVPVAAATLWLGEDPGKALAGLRTWQGRGVRHFALDVRLPEAGARVTDPARREQAAVEEIAAGLRAGGLEELLVLPLGRSDEDERRVPAPDLRKIPGARLGWTGPSARPMRVTLEDARRKARRAGVPVLFVETWMQATLGVPSAPRGRDPHLGEALEGIVVLPGPGGAEALARAWRPEVAAEIDRDARLLWAGCPPYDAHAGAAACLTGAAEALEAALQGRFSDPAWLRSLGQRAREAAQDLPAAQALVLARTTSERLEVDGRLDEPAWRTAPATALGPAQVRALGDGARVVLGVSLPGGLAPEARLELWIHGGRGPTRTRRLGLAARGCRGAAPPEAFEVPLEHYDLSGDPHPARRYAFDLRLQTPAGAWRLATPVGPPEAPRPSGALVVVR